MAASAIIIFISALFIQTISGQYPGSSFGAAFVPGLAAPGFVGPALAAEAAMAYGPSTLGLPGPGPCGFPVTPTTSGGGFMVTSSSPILPRGVTVQTDNMAIEGPLAVSGQLPFLSVVALEGLLPVTGQGAVTYGCGTGSIGILNEVGPGAYPYGPEMGPLGSGRGYNGFPNAYGPGCRSL